MIPVSSETMITNASETSVMPIAARCLIPKNLEIAGFSVEGNMHAAAIILEPLIITAPSCKGDRVLNIETNISWETSPFIFTPFSITSFNPVSCSTTINIPIFLLEHSLTAETSSLIAVISSFIKKCVSLPLPICANAERISG